MSTFRIVYDEDDQRASCGAVTLESNHAAEVLDYLAGHYAGRPVELWQDDECLGHITRMRDQGSIFWRVSA
jgi:hypothetical protein